MSLVEILLQGRCVNRQIQETLVANLCELENIDYGHVTAQKQGCGMAYTGDEFYSSVLLSAAIFEGERAPVHLEKIDGAVYVAEEVALFGHELSLAAPISRKDLSKVTMGFVFLRSRDPLLDGRLVTPCGINLQHPFARLSGWMLEPPSISLTGGLGAWGAEFLGWVKQAYIPDLRFWMDEEGHSKANAEVTSWRKREDKESQFAVLKKAFLALTVLPRKQTEETWEMETLFKEEGQKEIV